MNFFKKMFSNNNQKINPSGPGSPLNELIVNVFRQIGRENNCAPTVKTSDQTIIDIYEKITVTFSEAARKRNEVIDKENLNAIVFKFLQLNEMGTGIEFFKEHLDYELENYLKSGLRPDYLSNEIDILPITAEKYFERAIKKGESSNFNGAINSLNKAIELNPLNANFYIKRGQAKLSTKQLEFIIEACLDFEKALELDPNNVEASIGLANLEAVINPEKALEKLEKSARNNSDKSTYWNLGVTKRNMSDFEGAIEAFGAYINMENDKNSNVGEAYYIIGECFEKLNDDENALVNYNLSLKNNVSLNYNIALFRRGSIFKEQKQFEKAHKDFSAIILKEESNIDALIQRSEVSFTLGNKTEAIEDLRKVLILDENNFIALSMASEFYAANENYSDAIVIYNKLIEINSGEVGYYINIGICYYFIGENEKAINFFNKAITINDKIGMTFYYRGICHYNLKNNQSCADWKVALKLGVKEAQKFIEERCI